MKAFDFFLQQRELVSKCRVVFVEGFVAARFTEKTSVADCVNLTTMPLVLKLEVEESELFTEGFYFRVVATEVVATS